MKRSPVWFERTENLAIAAAVVVAFVHLHFAWWWLPVLFLAFDASMAGYVIDNRAGAIGYNLAHAYVGPAVLLLCYVLSGARWCALVRVRWAAVGVPHRWGPGARLRPEVRERLPGHAPRHNRQTAGREPGTPGGIIPPSRYTLARPRGRWSARLPVDCLAVRE
jgi:hypothetical protein